MQVGQMHAGEEWTDVLGWEKDTVVIDDGGFGVFSCGQTSVSVWVNKLAEGRGRFSESFDTDIYQRGQAQPVEPQAALPAVEE